MVKNIRFERVSPFQGRHYSHKGGYIAKQSEIYLRIYITEQGPQSIAKMGINIIWNNSEHL